MDYYGLTEVNCRVFLFKNVNWCSDENLEGNWA